MTTAHKHADVLRAIADGVPLSEFELTCHPNEKDVWDNMGNGTKWGSWIHNPEEWLVRRKQRTHVVDLNIRDYFAAKALPSILAPNPATGQYAQIDDFPACAVVAYAMADAMIKARNNK